MCHYTLCGCRSSSIAVAGADRTVYLYDCRSWRTRLRWRSPCKYDIVKLISANDEVSNRIYIAGHDNELFLCDLGLIAAAANDKSAHVSCSGDEGSSRLNASHSRFLMLNVSLLLISVLRSHVCDVVLCICYSIRADSRWMGVASGRVTLPGGGMLRHGKILHHHNVISSLDICR